MYASEIQLFNQLRLVVEISLFTMKFTVYVYMFSCTPGGWISEPSTVSIYEGRTTSEGRTSSEVGDVVGELHQAWGIQPSSLAV